MAAAAIPAILGAIQFVAPQIPPLVTWLEGVFGHSSTTGKKTGSSKLQTGVDVLMATLTSAANAGLIPSAGVVSPDTRTALAGAIQQTVTQAKSQGLLDPPPAEGTPIKSGTVPASSVPMPGTYLVTIASQG